MYQSPVSFISPLSPADYSSDDAHRRETNALFRRFWQPVGVSSALSRSGDQVTAEFGEIPVVVRNFDGRLTALHNVCSHRHCRLVSQPHSRSEKLKCPFHGWEFGADGRTRKIPAARNFPAFDRDRYRLQEFELDNCGDLIFVRCGRSGPSLREWLGEHFEMFAEWFSAPVWALSMQRHLSFPANWKIPIEASLESYHIPEVHPATFGIDPGEDLSRHAFSANSSSFYTAFNTPRLVDRALRTVESAVHAVLGRTFSGKYEHHHVLPNLLVSHTDSLTVVQTVAPVTATTSESRVWQFGLCSRRSNPLSRMTAWTWRHFTARLALRILHEDIRMYPHIQAGVSGRHRPAILERCEERLHTFQQFVYDHAGSVASVDGASVDGAADGVAENCSGCAAEEKESTVARSEGRLSVQPERQDSTGDRSLPRDRTCLRDPAGSGGSQRRCQFSVVTGRGP
ncbi:MAG: aromatic ring-hydroxylating dioxygenase subunit alpha [Planctomycetaceae bacterium]